MQAADLGLGCLMGVWGLSEHSCATGQGAQPAIAGRQAATGCRPVLLAFLGRREHRNLAAAHLVASAHFAASGALPQ